MKKLLFYGKTTHFQVTKVYFWGGMAAKRSSKLNFVFSSAALAEKLQVNFHFARWNEL